MMVPLLKAVIKNGKLQCPACGSDIPHHLKLLLKKGNGFELRECTHCHNLCQVADKENQTQC